MKSRAFTIVVLLVFTASALGLDEYGNFEGCDVYQGGKRFIVPRDKYRFYVPGTCYICSCLNKGLGYQSRCAKRYRCIEGVSP
ncbi:hypothetical protein DPMN_035709 [Dreissena polymorpha]|uniref:Uncharacterized protein n=1 Tax=Dreissena polymorpha TaxID=45954 RepID=A0A9D4M9N3_DREPO|nr:hypothetical protein DPMN_035709 [Dreissena polymorpha]